MPRAVWTARSSVQSPVAPPWPARIGALIVAAVVLAGGASGLMAQQADEVPVTRANVDARVAQIVEYLWKQQNAEGHWDAIVPPDKRKAPDPNDPTSLHGNRGGQTALVLLALKAAGADEQEARFQKALKWLTEQPWQGTYFRGLRATLYGQLRDPSYKKLLHDDGRLLLRSINGVDGMYSYNPPQGEQAKARGGDFSNTQYGILGMWSASDHEFEVPIKYWQLVEKTYLESVVPGGGWNYHYKGEGGGKAYGSMTAAGLATLFVVWDKLHVAYDPTCSRKPNPELMQAINSGLKWLSDNFSATTNPGRDRQNVAYYLYALERVGVASGLKYFGANHDWYKEVTWALLNKKLNPYGVLDMSWTLLFLSYGRAPVAVNKLQFGANNNWNERPRDYAGLCKHLGQTFEKHFNWQIMPLEAKQDEFHDAPILALSTRAGFRFTDKEAAKLRAYIDRGGLLFIEAVGNSSPVGMSVKMLCLQMYPGLELTRLPPEHPIYSAHSRLEHGQPVLLALRDGARTLVVFSPRDLSCDWQKLDVVKGKQTFQFGTNLVWFASDGGQLWSKEESYWPTDRGRKPSTRIRVGRVAHGSTDPAALDDSKSDHVWDPSAGTGWQRMDILSRNAEGPAIAVERVNLSAAVDPELVPVLHLTGTGPIVLGDQAKANLKKYVESGGLLLADSAGGGRHFTDSFTRLTAELFGQGSLVPPPSADLPFLDQVTDQDNVWYRHRNNLPRSFRPLELLGVKVNGAWNVLFVPCDLSYALVGSPAAEPIGLSPESAQRLALGVLAWRSGRAMPALASTGQSDAAKP